MLHFNSARCVCAARPTRWSTAADVEARVKATGENRAVARQTLDAQQEKAELTAKRMRAGKRRRSEEAAQAAADAEESGAMPALKRTYHASKAIVFAGFQSMCSKIPGLKRMAGQGSVHYNDIDDARTRAALRNGAYDFFCKDGDASFLTELAAELPRERRQEYIQTLLTRFRHEGSAVLQRQDIREVRCIALLFAAMHLRACAPALKHCLC